MAARWRVCQPSTSASQTLTSGKQVFDFRMKLHHRPGEESARDEGGGFASGSGDSGDLSGQGTQDGSAIIRERPAAKPVVAARLRARFRAGGPPPDSDVVAHP
jgi:hypothetical protein